MLRLISRLARIALPAVLGLLAAVGSVSAQHTYYISKSLGSNSHTSTQATSKSTPWASAPGMPSCSSNCASYTPVAGDSFIFYGGDTWGASDLGIYWNWAGSSTNCVLPYGTGATSSCIYIGVDKTWWNSGVCGSSWCRPIFNSGGVLVTNGAYIDIGEPSPVKNYVVVDSFELTGMFNSYFGGTQAFVDNGGDHVEFMHNYVHGWTYTVPAAWSSTTSYPVGSQVYYKGAHCGGFFYGTTASTGQAPDCPSSYWSQIIDNLRAFSCQTNGGGTCTDTLFHDNAIDGIDTPGYTVGPGYGAMFATYGGASEQIYNNYYRYVSGALVGSANLVHDNVVEYPVDSFDGNHCNLIFNFGPASGSNILMYNNVMRHSSTSALGCVKFWIDGNGSPATHNGYVFGNVWYDNDGGNMINMGNHPAGTYGPYYLFGNTVECGSDSNSAGCNDENDCASNMECWTVYEGNNDFISSQLNVPLGYCNKGGTCGAGGTQPPSITRTVSAANAQLYTSANGFSPQNGSGITVGYGSNLYSTYCALVAAVNAAAGTACQSGTSFGVAYNTTGHTVGWPGITVNPRPSSGAWDSGAYEWPGSSGSVTLMPGTLPCGTVNRFAVGSCGTVTLANTSGNTITLSAPAFSGSNAADFSQNTTTCGATLTTGSSCTYLLQVDPQAIPGTVETATMSVSFTGAAGSPLSVALSATVGSFAAAPTDLNLIVN
jgi:hypothetical protein